MPLRDIKDPQVSIAENVILTQYGDTVSVLQKGKNLNKFGANSLVGTAFETAAQFQGTTANETFVTTNIIDSIVSSSASDTTQTITLEGHTVDGSGNLTFVVQDAVLTGQTEVTLTTPLARCSRAFVKSTGTALTFPAALVGTVYIYDNTGGISSGVPVVPAATKCLILAGETRSQKAASSTSSVDYLIVTEIIIGVGQAATTANRIIGRLEVRDVANGGAWQPIGSDVTASVTGNSRPVCFSPHLIIPKNHDFRVLVRTDTSTAEAFAEINGHLAIVI